MTRQEHRRAQAGEARDQLADFADFARIETVRRFVDDQDLGPREAGVRPS